MYNLHFRNPGCLEPQIIGTVTCWHRWGGVSVSVTGCKIILNNKSETGLPCGCSSDNKGRGSNYLKDMKIQFLLKVALKILDCLFSTITSMHLSLWDGCVMETCPCPEGWYCCNDRFPGVFSPDARGENGVIFWRPQMPGNSWSPSKALETFPKLWTVGVDAMCRSKLSVQAAVPVPDPSPSLAVSHRGWLTPKPAADHPSPFFGSENLLCCSHSLKGGADVSVLTKQSLWGSCYS